MKIAIINYDAGNVKSVEFALNRIGINPIVTDNHELIKAADKVIFPGVGEASSAMNTLCQKGLDKVIPLLKQPVLGICIGMQLMCKSSEEGNTQCLNIFDEEVVKFRGDLKIPHIGWNTVKHKNHQIFDGIKDETYFYFVHSYYVPSSKYSIATCNYGVDYSVAIAKENFIAVQFHPEKSAEFGMKILENFVKIPFDKL